MPASPAGEQQGLPSVDDISKMFGQAGGSATSLDDLFGSLMGGAGGAAAGGGILAMIMNVLSGLFGGKSRSSVNSATASGSADMGSLFGSTAGKAVMGGIAAFLAKELIGKARLRSRQPWRLNEHGGSCDPPCAMF